MKRKQFVISIILLIFFVFSTISMESFEKTLKETKELSKTNKRVNFTLHDDVNEIDTPEDFLRKSREHWNKTKSKISDCRDDRCVTILLGSYFGEAYISQDDPKKRCEDTTKQMFENSGWDLYVDAPFVSLRLLDFFAKKCEVNKTRPEAPLKLSIGRELFANFKQKYAGESCEQGLDVLLEYLKLSNYKENILKCPKAKTESTLDGIFEQSCDVCPPTIIGYFVGKCGKDEQTKWRGQQIDPQSCASIVAADSEICSTKYFHFDQIAVEKRQMGQNNFVDVKIGECGCIEKSLDNNCEAEGSFKNYDDIYDDIDDDEPKMYIFKMKN